MRDSVGLVSTIDGFATTARNGNITEMVIISTRPETIIMPNSR